MGPLPDFSSALALLFILAIAGGISLLVGCGWLIYWLVTHVYIVIG